MSDAAVRAVRTALEESAAASRRVADSDPCVIALVEIATAIADALRAGKKVLICGNGGSAADAQHIAAELVIRLTRGRERRALPAMALTTDTSVLTACGNDLGFEDIFARQVEAHGRPGDIFVGLSTSGNSPNMIRAFTVAQDRDLRCIFFGGGDGGKLAALADLAFLAPSTDTSHIQEVHLASYHAVLFVIEDLLFGPVP